MNMLSMQNLVVLWLHSRVSSLESGLLVFLSLPIIGGRVVHPSTAVRTVQCAFPCISIRVPEVILLYSCSVISTDGGKKRKKKNQIKCRKPQPFRKAPLANPYITITHIAHASLPMTTTRGTQLQVTIY